MQVTEYPLDELQNSEILVEAEVANIKASGSSWYPATESFKATILQSFKGGLAVRKAINVVAAKEEAHAVCPVSLEEGKIYILVLNKNGKAFEISRSNIVVNSENENYKNFIHQIKTSLNQ